MKRMLSEEFVGAIQGANMTPPDDWLLSSCQRRGRYGSVTQTVIDRPPTSVDITGNRDTQSDSRRPHKQNGSKVISLAGILSVCREEVYPATASNNPKGYKTDTRWFGEVDAAIKLMGYPRMAAIYKSLGIAGLGEGELPDPPKPGEPELKGKYMARREFCYPSPDTLVRLGRAQYTAEPTSTIGVGIVEPEGITPDSLTEVKQLSKGLWTVYDRDGELGARQVMAWCAMPFALTRHIFAAAEGVMNGAEYPSEDARYNACCDFMNTLLEEVTPTGILNAVSENGGESSLVQGLYTLTGREPEDIIYDIRWQLTRPDTD